MPFRQETSGKINGPELGEEDARPGKDTAHHVTVMEATSQFGLVRRTRCSRKKARVGVHRTVRVAKLAKSRKCPTIRLSKGLLPCS